MTALHRKPAATGSAGRIVGAGVLGMATLAMLGLVWWSLSPILGRVYAGIRLAETATLWRFTEWGRYFTTMPAGQPFAFVSIYKSSVSFGLVASLLTALIGYLAWRKRSREHIEVIIMAPRDGFAHDAISQRFVPADRLVRPPVAEREPVNSVLAPAANPFTALRDLRDARAVETIVDDVPWHLAAVLFLTIDAAAPLRDREVRNAVLKAARIAANGYAGDPKAEVPASIVSVLHGHMLVALTDQAGRDMRALNQVHGMLGSTEDLADAIAALAAMALAVNRLFFPDYAWLRHVDPSLQSRITDYG
ncbi:hypothetical protein VQ02_04040 [Methylobacterium variabile]|jgi:hypothetical protein|uniref:Uncharacterized protein n=1 Tax=Methylobacterium variabile TaxID=298794 RepID=A0A0J6T842_9HYPH|nr:MULTISPECIES: hypothetical protein [Methylobacterium]KMO42094.1 hypothetical protein VQ02_04040 [Methylobacterium variabile]NGM37274.1 hypothetical protein [Methylobacterium sp. DB0501]UHC20371.1 hypothetical protein LRS73_34585 [Methylobacterium currus]